MNRGFWCGRRVFVTGHTGFKGSWLLLMLRELGAHVTGYSLPPPTDPSMFELLDLKQACTHEQGDVRDLDALGKAIERAAPEIVVHMAAQPLVRASYEFPVETYATNVMGTANLLEACRGVDGVRAIIIVTTDKCYENEGWTWGYRENDRLGGADPYSSSKAAAELVVKAYRHSFYRSGGAAVASARAGNVIGGGDFSVDRLIPDAMKAFIAGEPLKVRNPFSVRPWQHVLDPLCGYLLLAERIHGDRTFADAWNFGPHTDESVPVGRVVDRLMSCWGGDAGWIQDESEHPHEAATLKLDSTKARATLGWQPRLHLDQALSLTCDWYRAHADGSNLADVSVRQVRDFMQAS